MNDSVVSDSNFKWVLFEFFKIVVYFILFGIVFVFGWKLGSIVELLMEFYWIIFFFWGNVMVRNCNVLVNVDIICWGKGGYDD